VFTRSEKETPFKNVEFLSGSIPTFVRELKEQQGKNIWLFGGAEIIHPLLQENMIDEMILSIHPLILGAGVPLFKKVSEHKFFDLSDTISYPSGLVQLRYKK